ncbi:MAG: polysulfide reductase [Opitutus sp.]|nr:polysulfide reductase [Opitutus sp.]
MTPLEYTTTRNNPGVDPILEAWRIEVPIDLFAAALAAGLMVLAGLHLLVRRPTRPEPHVACTVGPLIGIGLLSAGLTALFLDLSHKLYVWRLYLTFEPTSPMSWGSYLMLLSYGALLANAVAHLPLSVPVLTGRFPLLTRASEFLFASPRRIVALGTANLMLGFSLGIYTGTLLSTLRARPLWNSPLLGPIFLISGLATAAALLHAVLVIAGTTGPTSGWRRLGAFIARFTGGTRPDAAPAVTLAWATMGFLALQAVLLGLYLVGLLTAPEVSQRAAMALVNGKWSVAFWCGVLLCGTLAPFVWQFLELKNLVRATVFPALLVALGAFLLRFVLVFAGQESHWVQRIAGH